MLDSTVPAGEGGAAFRASACRACLVSFGLIVAFATAALAHELTPSEARAIAEAFAPVVTFHPEERYFPCSPLVDVSSLAAGPGEPTESASFADLGNIRNRIAAYDALPLEAKLRAARVYYRVRPRDDRQADAIDLEYWFYYVNDTYHTRRGIIPIGLDASHPHDLEHVFLSLVLLDASDAGRRVPARYAIRQILASAHSNGIPNNRYDVAPGAAVSLPPSILVELGSHAMAPDPMNRGRYDRDDDRGGWPKFIWGIRDRGQIWARYSPSFTEPREPGRSVRLYPGSENDEQARAACGAFVHCAPYRLEPAGDIDARVGRLRLVEHPGPQLFDSRMWLRRLFGDVSNRRSLVPALQREEQDPGRMRSRARENERGLFIGLRSIVGPMPMAGARFAVFTRSRYVPDLLLDGTFVLGSEGGGRYEQNVLGSYPLDAITKAVAGVSVRSSSLAGAPRQIVPAAGLEFRLGRWSVRTLGVKFDGRTWLDYRVSYLVF